MRAICCAILALVFMKAWFALSAEKASTEQKLAGYAAVLCLCSVIAAVGLCIAGM